MILVTSPPYDFFFFLSDRHHLPSRERPSPKLSYPCCLDSPSSSALPPIRQLARGEDWAVSRLLFPSCMGSGENRYCFRLRDYLSSGKL